MFIILSTRQQFGDILQKKRKKENTKPSADIQLSQDRNNFGLKVEIE